MTVQMFSVAQKANIVKEFNSGLSKASLAKRWVCSTDTISRVIKEAGAIKLVAAPEPQKTAVQIALERIRAKADAQTPAKPAVQPTAQPVAKIDYSKYSWTMGMNYINIADDTGKLIVANSDHSGFETAKAALFNNDIETAINAINIKRAIMTFTQGLIRIENEEVFYKDIKMDTGLTHRILNNMRDGEKFTHLINFFENLMLNPSRRAVYELFGFLEHNDIELTDDGYFIAWKRVNENFTDVYTGKMDNSPGKVVAVDRNMVDEDAERTCSFGLHVAAKSYLPHYGGGRGKIVSCKVNPKDVVAIPTDYNNAKMRCCEYTVIADVTTGFSHY